MKTYTYVQMIQNKDIETFTKNVRKYSEELQEKGFVLEYDYKPVLFKRFFRSKILYTCMILAYTNRKS